MPDKNQQGRNASRPREIPKPGWREIFGRVKTSITDDHVSIVAAGVAFFGLLAIFPAIAAFVSIAGLILDPATVQDQLATVSGALPPEAAEIIESQARDVASGGSGIGLAAAGGILISLYSASKGMKSLMEGMNIAYGEDEDRGLIALNVTALALTLFLILGVLIAIILVLAAPAVLGFLNLPQPADSLITWGRWPLLAILTILGLSVVYRYGPSREDPEWRWVSAGAVLATVIWLVGSVALSIYVRNFGGYNETYGALGGVIILLLWLWLSGFVVLLGAELNAEVEHQTAKDTTTGKPRPKGARGARMADSVAKS
jgi:membrane protein